MRRACSTATSTPRASYSRRMVPVSVERGVEWFPAITTIGESGSPTRSRCSCWNRNRMAALVGRTEWKMSPANTIRSGRWPRRSSTARRNASATSASRWFPPRGVCRSYWRKPRCRSARCASFTASLGLGELERRLLRHGHRHLASTRGSALHLNGPAHHGAHLGAPLERVHLLSRESAGESERAGLRSPALARLSHGDRLVREARLDAEHHGGVRAAYLDL